MPDPTASPCLLLFLFLLSHCRELGVLLKLVDPLNAEEAAVERKRELVRTSWQKVDKIAATAAKLFYGRLFELDPDLHSMFADADMDEQGLKLTEMISLAVSQLRQIEEVIPVLRNLGQRHITYGVHLEMYDTVGQALLWALGRGLGDEWTAELQEAWTWVYGIIVENMAGTGTASKVKSHGAQVCFFRSKFECVF